MPAPQELTADFSSGAGGAVAEGSIDAFDVMRLSGRMPLGGAGAGRLGETSGEENRLSRPERMLLASDLETSTTLLEALSPCAAPPGDEALPVRCIHRPRTLSTALKKPVEASLNVRERASLVGASCCSIFNS